MSIYPELDNLNLDELINRWHESPIDGEEYASSYYSEVAFLIRNLGETGITFLLNEINLADTERLAAILFFLPPLKHPTLRNILLQHLHDPRPSIVAGAIDGLRIQGEGEATEEVLGLLTHQSPYVRGSVLRYISDLNPKKAHHLLLQALQDPHYIVRENAIDELEKLGLVDAIEYIKPLLADPHPDVQQASATAIHNLEQLLTEESEK